MTYEEFQNWMILERLEPFGEYAEHCRAGLLASMLANIHRSSETEPYSIEDFMPETFRVKKARVIVAQTIEDQIAMLDAMVALSHG